MNDASTIGATMGRVLMIAAVAAAMLLALPAVAGAQQYPPPPKITVENPNVTVTIEGDDWEPGTEVTIERHVGAQSASAQSTDVEVLGTTTVRPDGTFEFAAAGLEAGDEVEVRGAADDGERVDRYAVADDSAEVVASQMPATGLAVWQALALGGGLILAGGVFTVAARRKRSTVTVD